MRRKLTYWLLWFSSIFSSQILSLCVFPIFLLLLLLYIFSRIFLPIMNLCALTLRPLTNNRQGMNGSCRIRRQHFVYLCEAGKIRLLKGKKKKSSFLRIILSYNLLLYFFYQILFGKSLHGTSTLDHFWCQFQSLYCHSCYRSVNQGWRRRRGDRQRENFEEWKIKANNDSKILCFWKMTAKNVLDPIERNIFESRNQIVSLNRFDFRE